MDKKAVWMNWFKRLITKAAIAKIVGVLDMNLKGWRTIGVNVLMGLSFLLGWEQLTEWIKPEIIATILAIVNIALRYITTTPIGKST
jgi:hypothetical protein